MKTVRDALAPHGGTVRVFCMDEARFGQQGTTTRVWAPTGSRPTAVKQTRYEWVYLYAAVESSIAVPKQDNKSDSRGHSSADRSGGGLDAVIDLRVAMQGVQRFEKR